MNESPTLHDALCALDSAEALAAQIAVSAVPDSPTALFAASIRTVLARLTTAPVERLAHPSSVARARTAEELATDLVWTSRDPETLALRLALIQAVDTLDESVRAT